MKLLKRRLWIWIAIAIGVIILLTLIVAPANNQDNRGSTYSYAPDGYGAWYAYMEKRGASIHRWQKTFQQLAAKSQTPVTLVRINSALQSPNIFSNSPEYKWIQQGNTLVILGVFAPPTNAKFSTLQENNRVKIDTTRREKNAQKQLLGDEFGAIVWQQKLGNGQLIYSTTPHLAANAYQDFLGNYEFLAQVVTENKTPLWIDEYIHGYKDKDVIEAEIGADIFSYLAKTPLLPVLVQVLILLVIAIWADNRRLGEPAILLAPTIDNSEAYIQALGGVLHKAESSDFLISRIAQEEQRQLQKALGLGETLVESKVLIDAWEKHTGQVATELTALLKISTQKPRLKDRELKSFLEEWQEIRLSL